MTRMSFALWATLFGAVFCLTPIGTTPASGCGESCGVRYVYVYVDRPGAPTPGPTGKVWFFLAMNTADPDAGYYIQLAEKSLAGLYDALPEKYRGEAIPVTVKGEGLTRENIIKKLQALEVGPRDTLFVFCNTHGESSGKVKDEGIDATADPAQNLLMYAKDGKKPDKLRREELRAILASKPCRLKLLITDCCFGPEIDEDFDSVKSYVHNLLPVGRPPEPGPKVPNWPLSPLEPNRDRKFILEDLFLNHEGLLDLTSCSKGQYAIASVFTDAFDELIRGNQKYSPILSWDSFIDQLNERIDLRFKVIYPKLDPRMRLLVDKQDQKTQKVFVFTDKTSRKRLLPRVQRIRIDDQPSQRVEEKVSPTSGPPVFAATGTPGPTTGRAQAAIRVHLPADARLFIDGAATTQTGPLRFFSTPPLTAGMTSSYAIRAERTVDGQVVTEIRTIKVKAGEETVVSFDGLSGKSYVSTH